MNLAEGMLKYIIRFVMEHAPEEMNFFNQFVDKGLLDRLNNVLNSEFGRITYTEAVKLLEEHNDQFIVVVLSLAATDDLADTGNQTVYSRYSFVVGIHLHIEGFDFLWIVCNKYRLLSGSAQIRFCPSCRFWSGL